MITDLKAFCELFYASTSIPIGYYHASPDDDCSFPSILEDPSVFKGICPVSDISQKTRTILSRSPSAIMVI